MSHAFDAFVAQYNATGSEKADGYSQTVFTDMAPDERVKAFEMLSGEVEAAPQSAKWLFFIDKNKALTVCEKAAEKMVKEPYSGAFIVLYYIFENTQDCVYQKKMISQYADLPDHLKSLAIEYIGKTSPTVELSVFLKSIMLTEVIESAVNRAAFYFMRTHAVPAQTDEEKTKYRNLLALLKDKDVERKQKAINFIEGRYPITA